MDKTNKDIAEKISKQCENSERSPIEGFLHKGVSLFRHSNRGLITKGTIGSPVGKRPPFAKRVQNI